MAQWGKIVSEIVFLLHIHSARYLIDEIGDFFSKRVEFYYILIIQIYLSKKGQIFVWAAPKIVSFSQLPVVKKTQNVALLILLDL